MGLVAAWTGQPGLRLARGREHLQGASCYSLPERISRGAGRDATRKEEDFIAWRHAAEGVRDARPAAGA